MFGPVIVLFIKKFEISTVEHYMKWMQFFTPVSSITWEEAHLIVDKNPDGQVVFLDVRQPKEYVQGHLPGAKLIPLGELENRLEELEKDKPIIIY
jgi:sulfur-carrier protein adenylyltransferase/sulfurtransferase